jgi:hypothetical protein
MDNIIDMQFSNIAGNSNKTTKGVIRELVINISKNPCDKKRLEEIIKDVAVIIPNKLHSFREKYPIASEVEEAEYLESLFNKALLRGTPIFYRVNPEILETLDEHSEYLESLLNSNCYLFETSLGKFEICEAEQKATIKRFGKIKIEIYSKEHAPPHFHITDSQNINLSFSISDFSPIACQQIQNKGRFSSRNIKLIKNWYDKSGKKILINNWNNTRPGNCPVGKLIEIKESA